MACTYVTMDGCDYGSQATPNGCFPCGEIQLASTGGGNTVPSDSDNEKFNIDKYYDYAKKGVDIFGDVLNIFKKNKNKGGSVAPSSPQPQPTSSIKYVWYALGGVVALVAVVALFKYASK